MIKYYNYDIVFQEYPDEVTLAVNLTLCPNRCPGCHSEYLRSDIGEELTEQRLEALVNSYGDTITCVGFQGGDNDPQTLLSLAQFIRRRYAGRIRTGWYSGRTWLPQANVLASSLDYVKTGAYVSKFGPLSSPTTNQRFYKVSRQDGSLTDSTARFRKNRPLGGEP